MSQPQAKRGCPRKYVDPSVAMPMPLAIVPARHPTNDVLRPPVMPLPVPPPPPPPVKKRRVQVQRSTTTKKTAAGVIGMNHEVITVEVGEGYFEMISLSGSYQPSETDGMSSGTGGLSVSLASVDGRIFGGQVAGPLTAASPVQVVVGRFQVDENKKLNQAATGGVPGSSSSTPRGALNESSGSAQN
nr:AT-hook motif nuclear-localized protein 1-like [Lolium perenne]